MYIWKANRHIQKKKVRLISKKESKKEDRNKYVDKRNRKQIESYSFILVKKKNFFLNPGEKYLSFNRKKTCIYIIT